MNKLLFTSAALTMCAISAFGQTDTIRTTLLHEVAVVGVKQQPSTELSATTTVTSEQISRYNIVTMKGVSEIAPNFFLPDYGSRMTSSIYVRGLGARIDQPVVGLSVDNVPYLNKDSYDFDLFDIEKIDIHRGAQSILNGRNTMCGQININTLSPWSYQGWRFMAEYGRANSIKAAAGYYGRISPKLATSVTAYYTMTDGFFDNEHTGKRLDWERQGSMRWKLSWHPSSRLSMTNVASAQVSRQGGYPYQSVATGKIAMDDTCFYRRNSFADGLTVGWTGKRVIVTSVTSVQYIDDNMTLDQDFMPEPYFTLSQMRKELALTQDLYARATRGSLSWLGGVFGFYKHMDMKAPVTFKDSGVGKLIEEKPNNINPSYPIEWDSREFVLGSDFINPVRGAAAYAQATYKLGKWDFEGGIRWDLEHTSLDYRSHCNTGYTVWHVLPDGSREVFRKNPVKIDDGGHLSHTFNQLLPKVAVGYNISPEMRAYVNVAKGYKAGGFNTQMFSDVLQQRIMGLMGITMTYDVDEIVSYKPEKSWNYELGYHVSLPSAAFDIDATAFYISCTDQQLTAFPDGLTTGRIMTNAGRTRSVGAELTLSWRPIKAVCLRGSYGYTNATFRRYNDGKADYRGKRLPYAPQNTLFLSANWELPCEFGGIRPSVDVNMRGVGKIYWDDANTVVQPFYATLGASIGLQHPRWSLRIWGENLTDTKYTTFYFVSMSNAFVQRARPWMLGATLRLNIPKL